MHLLPMWSWGEERVKEERVKEETKVRRWSSLPTPAADSLVNVTKGVEDGLQVVAEPE